ncbi:hypothetical protein OH76DRAFT_1202073 [Lentinus brumalis]|uniref:Uncharacterized protein n=1 Tax=Lentinus brumalis TaxID=2498619 RepID=A0A371CSX2_9APHY|nr:hypothetical protein OH76DRAFT_1202073 [Polyporus brumalis]
MSDSPPTKKQRGLDDRASQDHGVHPSGTVLDVGQRVQTAHRHQVSTHVGPYVAPVEGSDVRHDLGQHVRHDTGQHVHHNVGQHVRNDLGQHVRHDTGPYVGTNVAPYIQPAGDHNRRTDAERQVQPTLGRNPITLPPFPPNLVRTDAAPRGDSDVMQHILPRDYGQHIHHDLGQHVHHDLGQHVHHDTGPYVGTNVAPHVQPVGDPNIHTDAGRHVQPVLGVNANALPPFPPDLHPPPMAHVGTHINKQGQGNVFGGIRNPDAAQVQHGARTYAPGRSEPQPQGYPQLRSHDHNNADGRVQPPTSMSGRDQVASNGHPYNDREFSWIPCAQLCTHIIQVELALIKAHLKVHKAKPHTSRMARTPRMVTHNPTT